MGDFRYNVVPCDDGRFAAIIHPAYDPPLLCNQLFETEADAIVDLFETAALNNLDGFLDKLRSKAG